MASTVPIRSLTIQNLLSFGDQPTTVELRNLNVLIGPNGSGKSNLIEVLGLLQNAPKDLAKAISKGGIVDEWLWKGSQTGVIVYSPPTASIEAIVNPRTPLRYRLAFTSSGFLFRITDECIEDALPVPQEMRRSYFSYVNGRPMLGQNGDLR